MRRIILFLLLSMTLLACTGPRVATNSPAGPKRYQLKGKVISVDKAAKKAEIDHEAVADYMPAMTMEFPIHADWVWDDLTPGSDIRAELVVDNTAKEPYWLENIGIVALPNANQSPLPVNEKFAQVGKEVPDFSLVDQDGKKISMRDFRGKALAITFIYRECPLPEYCIKMSRHFSDLANQVNPDTDLKGKIQLLSISFDPKRDTPEKLKQYGLGYLGAGARELGVWKLAVGKDDEVRKIADFFGLRYEVDENDTTQINHSLRTAVISPDGIVKKVFSGNEWTTDELLRELTASMAK